ncbi:MAG TPA: hypothetical protein VGX21_08280 [Methylomirabilota bacterium]|jgi:hypothetical protein|nr:hypothetical protein [Methylomirabilota bacterium]
MAEQLRVLEVREVPARDVARLGKLDVWVLYQIDAGPVESVHLPAEGFTEDKLRERVKAARAQRASWAGKTLNL